MTGWLPYRNRRTNRLNLIAGVLVVLVAYIWFLGTIDKIVMPIIVRAGMEVAVPDLRYRTVVQADSLCRKYKLKIINIKTRRDDRLPPGVVLDQYPVAGAVVKPGRHLELVVSQRSGLVICPDLIGKSPREAKLSAEAADLKIRPERIRYQHSDTAPEGVIIGQDPSPAAGIALNSEIILTVSLGSLPAQILVPNLIGHNIDEIPFLLRKYNLNIGEVVRFPDRSQPEGTIIEQEPLAGAEPPESGCVNIRVSIRPVGSETDSLTQ